MSTLYCYANHQIQPIEQWGVPVTDLWVQRGYGIFDFLRVAHGKPLFLEQHLERLFNSASIMHLTIKESKEEIKKIVAELIEKNKMPFSGIRMFVSGGDSADGYTISAPRLVVLQQVLAVPDNQLSTKGIHLVSHPFQRQLAEVKTTDYLMAIWLQPWMKSLGADDILYYHKESITECPRSNIFMVTPENKLITPATQMLKGITRQNILKVAAAHQIEVEIRPIELAEIKTAKEVFISSSTKRILPVSRLDDHFFPEISSNLISARLFSYLLELEQ